MKLNVKSFGLACGTIFGVALFLVTILFIIGGLAGNTLVKLHNIFIGYAITWPGAFIGLVWGFVTAFIGGAVFAWLYNSFTKEKKG